MSETQCRRLFALARWSLDCTHGAAVEVGCWEGKSTAWIARALAPMHLHCIDHWLGDIDDPRGWGITPQLAASRNVYGQFTANMAAEGAHNLCIHRQSWQAFFVGPLAPAALRFCHIDAAHDYRSVADNIASVWPRMVPGGILCGDDANQREVARAVRDRLGSAVNLEVGWDLKLWWVQC